MNRRRFLGRLAAAVVGLTLARELPGIAAGPPRINFAPEVVQSSEIGISIRLIQAWESEAMTPQSRLDCVYALPALRRWSDG